MIITELLKDLSQKGIQLWREGNNLRYRAPQGVLTSKILDILRQHKAEILQQLHLAESKKLAFQPLSHGQEALWLLYKIAPDSIAYNLFATVRIGSVVEIDKLNLTWQILLERHPILQTVYTTHNGQPVQLLKDTKVEIPLVDAALWSEEVLNREILAEADRPFNLENIPILRLIGYVRSPQENILLLVTHHIAFDFWSVDLLLHEFRILYQEIAQKGQNFSSNCLPPCLSYTNYINWQQRKLASAEGERLWKYWQEKLAGDLPILHLPTDRIRPPVQTYTGASYSVNLDEELLSQLKALAKAEGTTLYTTLMAAFQVLLYRYTNQEDILVGTPTLGRDRADFEGIVGYLTNPVVLRGDVSFNPTFKEFLERIRQTVLEALENESYPFPLLVEKLKVDRDPTRSPIFQVFFTFNELRRNTLAESPRGDSEERIELLTVGQRGAAFDLDLRILNLGSSLALQWVYNTDLFEATTIERMAGHFLTLLSAIVVNSKIRVSELPLLTERERHQLLVEWNNTTKEYPQDKCIHQLFEAQVERTPDAVAVVFEGEQLSYRALNARANQLAHYLQKQGVKPEELVGICAERSLEMVVGLLGILKAGGAYVPLDPAYPSERLALMLEDSSVPLLMTQHKLVERLPRTSAQVICLDSDWHLIEPHSQENPLSGVGSSNLAYVIYTSGSTGNPKGVLGLHQGAVNRLNWMWTTYPFAPDEVCCQKTSLSFVDSVWEIFGPLLQGVPTLIIPESVVKDPRSLVQTLAINRVTRLVLVPSLLRVILKTAIDLHEILPKLKYWVSSGERLEFKLWQEFCDRLPGKILINLYGSSEVSADVTCYDTTENAIVREISREHPVFVRA